MRKNKPNIEQEAPAYIDWQEFNKMVAAKGANPSPTRDSRGDSGFDEAFEVHLGESYAGNSDDDESGDRGDSDDAIVADSHSTLDNEIGSEDLIGDGVGVISSERPDSKSERILDR